MRCCHPEYFNSESGTKMNCFEPCCRACMCVCIVCVCMCVCICVYECMYVCIVCVCMYVCMNECMYVCMCVCECMYVCMYVYVCMYLYVCMYVCMHACMHYVWKRAQNDSWLTNSGPEQYKGVSPVLHLILHIVLLDQYVAYCNGMYLDLQTSAFENA
jgi:hypothetical protein